MAAKPRKSAVQSIIKNLLEGEIPEIQNASKELAEWIKLLEQHSFKLQHYATEIETWAAEEDEGDSIELTDLIKDLEATLSDMRLGRPLSTVSIEEPAAMDEKILRSYGRTGRLIREPKALPRAEIREDDERVPPRRIEPPQPAADQAKPEPARTPQGVLVAKDSVQPRVKAELPAGGKETVVRKDGKTPSDTEGGLESFTTPEGFRFKRMRP
jgi:hypothetical protein